MIQPNPCLIDPVPGEMWWWEVQMRERRKRQSVKEQRRDWRARQQKSRRERRLIAAGYTRLPLWLPIGLMAQGWLISRRLDPSGAPPEPETLINDLEKILINWAQDKLDLLQKLGSRG